MHGRSIKKFFIYLFLIFFVYIVFYVSVKKISNSAGLLILNFNICVFLAWLILDREEAKNKNIILQQQKKAEKELKENENFYRSIFELSGVGIAEVSVDGQFIKVNEKFCKITSYPENELKEKTFIDITYIEDLYTELQYFSKVLNDDIKGYNLEKRYIRKDGSIIWVNLTVSIVKDPENIPKYFVSIINDITENKKNEIELKKQAQAMLYSPLSIVITDKSGIIEYVNPAFETISGYKKEDAIGKTPRVQGSGEHPKEFYENLWNTILKGDIWKGVFKNKKKDGNIYWEKASISPIVNSKNEITHFVAIKEDISKRKMIEEALIKSKKEAEQANKVKSAFIANMSHEIRTPLNSILGFSNILLKDSRLDEDQKNKLEIINKTGEHLLRIINEILQISKLEAGKVTINKRQVNLHTLMEDLKNIFYLKASENDIELKFIFDSKLPQMIITDELKLKQILINLIGNSLKFTSIGSICIFAKVIDENGDNYLEIIVKDTGMGIKEENIDKIFEYFTQIYDEKYSKGGTGLGLSIVKEFVDLLGGSISIESIYQEGSQFTILLPVKVLDDFSDKNGSLKEDNIKISYPREKNIEFHINKEIKEVLKEAILDGDIKGINELLTEENINNEVELQCLRKLSKEFKFEKMLEKLS